MTYPQSTGKYVLNVDHEIAARLTRGELIQLMRRLQRGAQYALEAYVGDSRTDKRLLEIHGELSATAAYFGRCL